MKSLVLAVMSLLSCRATLGFIPPVRQMVEAVVGGRNVNGAFEVVLSHRVQVPGGQVVTLEERIVSEGNRAQILWRPNGGSPLAATWERQAYTVSPQAVMNTRSSVFMKYLLGASEENFLQTLLNENFVNRDQLVMFNSGYSPKGDPATWKTRNFYKQHDDIFLHRLASGVAIAVVGLDEGAVRKAIYFDDNLKGIARLEWGEGQGNTHWDFAGFAKQGIPGYLPKRLSFTYQGTERVSSTLVAARPLKGKALTDFRGQFNGARSSGVPSNLEPALKVLLSYR